ncbi:MAG: type II secretion system protein N [Sphingobium sp.]|nr:type II secretion system protein N [Sphingobium sp.]
MSFLRSRRARIWTAVAIIVALVATFPLSLAFSLLGLKDMGVTARSLRGPVWWGGAEELSIAGVRLGTVNVFLDPFHLLIGQAQVELIRVNGRPDDLLGAVVVGPGVRGVERVTGSVPLGNTFAALSVGRATFDKFSVRFGSGRCVEAEGRVRASVMATFTGLDLANGLSGEARCDGETLLLPLASQSGQERIDLRVRGNGAYEASMRIRTNDPVLAGALAGSGFQAVNGEQVLRISGTL